MTLPKHKTKIVCTIGPASQDPEILERMIRAGMNIARINFSHGDFASHRSNISNIRAASRKLDTRVAIMADLPGPKIRIGKLSPEPVMLQSGDTFLLTTDDIVGDRTRASVTFPRLVQSVAPGDHLFLNDGFIELQAETVTTTSVQCRVLMGGELRSHKGLNVPDTDLAISAFTDRDRECLEWALGQGVDAVSQSFVESAADIVAVREAAEKLGYHPFVIAKIERARAVENMDAIIEAADGIMIARGDLGVEIPIEQIAVVQKSLMRKANLLGKPVITATQMLESMTNNRRPTRAESTDVANAILDGTDCVMLSGESAMGRFPVESVEMLGRIAVATEPLLTGYTVQKILEADNGKGDVAIRDLIALSVATTVHRVCPAAVFVPTRSGATARSIARFRLPIWITGSSRHEDTCQRLLFSHGVFPLHLPNHPDDWQSFIQAWLREHGIEGHLVILTEGPSSKNPEANERMEIIDLRRKRSK
ncbi:MAG: pyruvate kinase [Thermodesulfobacteriota bacterium]